MGFLKVIRRWALREKMPIREIARRTGVSHKTIKKYLREGIVEPAFQVPHRPSKLDPFAKYLTAWLTTDQRKSRKVKWSGKFRQRAKMYPALTTGYGNDDETRFFGQV
jgi:transposase